MRWALWVVLGGLLAALLAVGWQHHPSRAAVNEPIACAQLPALTSDVTTSVGSCVTTASWHKISTQTASASASIQWTGLGSTYNNYVLDCYGLYPVTNNVAVYVQFGEGGTPTWETANYRWSLVQSNSGNTTVAAASSSGTDSGLNVAGGGILNVSTAGGSAHGVIHNMVSTSYYTDFQWVETIFESSTSYNESASGQYTGDNTAKTAIRVIAASGNLNGTCSLWALVPP